jgi:hypothetical protein
MVHDWLSVASLCAILVFMSPQAASAPREIQVDASPLQFNPLIGAEETERRLRWIGGLELKSNADGFGGFSGLVVSPDGHRLTAVTDGGDWLTAKIVYAPSGEPVGLSSVLMGELRDISGHPFEDKNHGNAEALATVPHGEFLIAFEYVHRIWRYPDGLSETPAELSDVPLRIEGARNRGIEALAVLADGRLIAVQEGGTGNSKAYLFDGSNWLGVTYATGDGFRPTGADRLPSGEILVLERRYSQWSGFTTRLRGFDPAQFLSGAVLQPREVVKFGPTASLYNLEGLAVHSGPSDQVRLTLISDDNFHMLLPTVILMFEWID